MARGSSQSQSSAMANRGGGPVGPAPRGTAAATAGLRRRRSTTAGATGGGGGLAGGNNMLRFYTDDAPGLKITPTVVLVMSSCFIGFVTALHVIGKFYRYNAGGV